MLPDIDRREILPRLYELLAEQAKKYTMGESSSIPVDTARELVNSLWYTLGFADVTARDLWAEVEKAEPPYAEKPIRHAFSGSARA